MTCATVKPTAADQAPDNHGHEVRPNAAGERADRRLHDWTETCRTEVMPATSPVTLGPNRLAAPVLQHIDCVDYGRSRPSKGRY
jgi:hypothetical protein